MIIAGYPGVGKTYYAKDRADVLDMEKDPYMEYPDYAERFVNDLIEAMPHYRHILIPTDLRVLEELNRRSIPFTIMVPDPADTEPDDEYGYARRLDALYASPSSDKVLQELMEHYYRILLLKNGEYLSDWMQAIDRKLENITVDKAFPARLVSAKHFDGTAYDENDWRQEFVGKTGTVAFLNGLCYGRRNVAFFFIDALRGRMSTSPGLPEYKKDKVTFNSRGSVYVWELVGPEVFPERHKEIEEEYIFLR